MSELPVSAVPTTIVTGFLGTGKSTAILDFFRNHPGGERWAVLVNEFGEVGIDGAVLRSDGLAVREIPGGCICCGAGLALKVTLVRLLREVRPDRLFIEPSGLARPASVVDLLRSPGIAPAVSLRAVVGLVNPRHLDDARYTEDDTWNDQVRLADVLVANHCDRSSEAQLARFQAWAASLYPPKLVIAATEHGRMDPSWLSLAPPTRASTELPAAGFTDLRPAGAPTLAVPSPPIAHDASRWPQHGWLWPAATVFDRDPLEAALQALVRPCPALPAGVERLKGLFRTPRVWLLVDATSDTITYRAVNHRRDSRVEIIAPPGSAPDWDAVLATLRGAMLREAPAS